MDSGTTTSPLMAPNRRFVTGNASYVHNAESIIADKSRHWHIAFVRSASAQVALESIDSDCALCAPGVIVILTGRDFAQASLDQQCIMPSINPLILGVTAPVSPILPVEGGDSILYAGQAVAIVIASSREQAIHAAGLVQVNTRDGHAGSHQPVAQISFKTQDFRAQDLRNPNATDHESIRVNTTLKQPRVYAFPMEPRALMLEWHSEQNVVVRLGTQAPARARSDIANCLGLPESSVRVIAPDVGGAFGAKASVSPEELAIALAAKILAKRRIESDEAVPNSSAFSLKWTSPRSEEFLAAMQGRGAHLQAHLDVSTTGKLLQLQARHTFALGAWLPFSAVVPLRNAARILPGPYLLNSIDIVSKGTMDCAAAVNIYRGAGRPEAAIVMESLIDKAAHALSIDPLELRRRNLIVAEQMPYTTPTGEVLDSGTYIELLDHCATLFAYAKQREQQAMRCQNGELVGIGIAMYLEPCGQGWESAKVSLSPDGQVLIASGSATQGQGHELSYARIAQKILSRMRTIADGSIQVVQGDSALCPAGIGALASRSTAIGGSAVAQACDELLAEWEAQSPAELQPNAQTAWPSKLIEKTVRYSAPMEAWASGCVICQVNVDRDTGQPRIEQITWVDDAGEIISPELVKGQLMGGLAQGLGQAMLERMVYDEQGQLLTGSLMDYALPRADDLPDIANIQIASFPRSAATQANRLSAKGVGEAGCIGIPAALLGAVRDALKNETTQIDDIDFPLTAARLWSVMNPEEKP